MRNNILVLALLLCGGFSLAAQSRPDASIYVTPVTGTGSKAEDNSVFYKQLVLELTGQKFNLAKAQDGAGYSLIGSLGNYTGCEGQFVFHLELRENQTGELKAEGDLLYEAPGDVNQQFPVLVTTLLYTIPIDPAVNDEWRNKWLYFGLAVTWTPHFYIGDGGSLYLGDPHGGFSAECHFLNFLSFETGIELAVDWLNISGKDYRNPMLEIPLLAKFVIKPGSYFMIEPYAGAYINIPFSDTTKPPLFSWLAGVQSAVKVGPGAIFLDGRFAMDIGKSTVKTAPGVVVPPYQRYIINIGLGYKYGLFQRNKK